MYEDFLKKQVKATYLDDNRLLYFDGVITRIENGIVFGTDIFEKKRSFEEVSIKTMREVGNGSSKE
jgi:hypothetical protein